MAAPEEKIASLPFLRRIVPELPVWQLRDRGPGAQMEAHKIELLERLLELSTTAFLVYSEDPVADELTGPWERVGEETWRVPANADHAAIVRWLYLGGWMLYSAEEPVKTSQLFSIGFAPAAETLLEAATGLGLRFILVSFHDDVLWTIALAMNGLHE